MFEELGVVRPTIELQVSRVCWCPFDPKFLQMMVNRLIVGRYRHGKNTSKQKYLNRLKGAITHYEETGNQEFLLDAANYALLEAHHPSLPNAHFKHSDSQGRTQRWD
jgi:hypothetical protein